MKRQYSDLRRRFYSDYWHRTANDFGAKLEALGNDYFRISYKNLHTYVRGYEVQIDDHVLLAIAGDKALSQNLLSSISIPVPQHLTYELNEIARAREFLVELGGPVVVKPVFGSGGRSISTGIDNINSLNRASFLAASVCNRLLIEEQLSGDNYRLLYLDGKLIDIIRRDPPTVIGDSVHNIHQLIQIENELRVSGPPFTALSALTIDHNVKKKLRAQGLSTNSILEMNQSVIVKSIVNQNNFRDNHRYLTGVHSSYQEIGRRVQEVLNIKLMGVDVITSDINVALEDSGGGINEINTTPALHHHDLISNSDDACPVGLLALEYIFTH